MSKRPCLSALVIGAVGFALGVTVRTFAGEWLTPTAANASAVSTSTGAVPTEDGKLRIIAFGAHPDDCELQAGAAGAMWAAQGHHVKFVSVTNGDIGHWREAGGPLARRRTEEVRKTDAMLGITSEVLDIHDGELLPTLENRRTLTRLIREWKADLVLCPRPNDYHPDHRNTGLLVQDSAFMVTVPFFVPDVPPLRRNPVFLFYADRFQKPNPFRPDVVVSIDTVAEKTLDALMIMESQFLEGGALGGPQLIPSDPTKLQERRRQVREGFANRYRASAQRFRTELAEWYGKDRAEKIGFAQGYEVCEYGRQPGKEELRRLFPFFP